jgi:hypothetical protein
MSLPVRHLGLDAKVDRLFLREIAVSNFVAQVAIDNGRFTASPVQCSLNGAPVQATADLNLAVKGWTYAVTFKAGAVPLEPLANSFLPDAKGQYRGLLLADSQIKGAGITGTNLAKNLSGQVGFSFTNANLQLLGPKAKLLIWPIATFLGISDISQSPLNWMAAQVNLGGGQIRLEPLAMQSAAFEARARGTVPIAEVLNRSPLNLPVEFSLRRSLAQRASLMPADAPPDAAYVRLPDFVTVKGTLGEPKTEMNKAKLGGLLLKSGIGIAEQLGVKVGDKTGGVLQGVGNLLTGDKPAAAATNQSGATNPVSNLLDLFKKKPAK